MERTVERFQPVAGTVRECWIIQQRSLIPAIHNNSEIFIQAQFYIDLSNPDILNEQYEKARAIFGSCGVCGTFAARHGGFRESSAISADLATEVVASK